MSDVEIRDAAVLELKQTVRGLKGYIPLPRSHWGKALNLLSQIAVDTELRDLAVFELRQTTVGYSYFTKKNVFPPPGSYWGKALSHLNEIGVTMKVTVVVPSSPLAGIVTVSASVSPASQVSQVTRVEFRVDGSLKATDTSSPYSFSWATDDGTVSNGSHTLRAKAFWSTNKVAESNPVTVTVDNTTGPEPPPDPQPPVNTTLPSISGTATVGSTLTCSTGNWNPTPTGYRYQWLECDGSGASCVPIPSATASSYTIASGDAGSTLRCNVTALNGDLASAPAQTAQTAAVTNPGAVPVNTVAPTVSGNVSVGSTLTVSNNGSWTNSPTSYTYRWKSCDSAGANCAVISGATSITYVSTSSDIGKTIRCGVTAVNGSGSSSEVNSSPATGPISSGAPSGYYYIEHFDGAFTNSFWSQPKPGGVNTFISPGTSGQGIRVTDCASVSGTQHCSGSQSSYGQEGGMTAPSTPSEDRPKTGRIPGTGTGLGDGNGGYKAGSGGVSTWYRFKVRFPTGFQATPGLQNVFWEPHVDQKTEADGAAIGGWAYSTALNIHGSPDSSVCTGSPKFCTQYGTQPKLVIQVPGGPIATNQDIPRYYPFAAGSLLINHWYDMVIHAIWSPFATEGLVEWWVDGILVFGASNGGRKANLYTRRDGTYSYASSLGLYNYRLWSNWESSIDFDEFVWGPTRASVGF